MEDIHGISPPASDLFPYGRPADETRRLRDEGDTVTNTHPGDEPVSASGSQSFAGGSPFDSRGGEVPLRGAPLQSAAPVPSAEAFTAANESASALRAGVVVPHVENVGRGLLFSLAAVPLGVAAAVAIWQMGFIASITSFLIAAAAVWLYTRGAGAAPRAGLVPLVAVIVAGVVASFLAVVASDLVQFYNSPEGAQSGWPSATSFVLHNLFNAPLLASYGSDMAMFGVFAALGVFGTLRRLMAANRA
jgi:hypothetical protein